MTIKQTTPATDIQIDTADTTFRRLATIYSDAVSRFVAPQQPFALLDFPYHKNVGDSAIWMGELAYFDAHVGLPPAFVNASFEDPTKVLSAFPDGPVFIHGGGNFGDIWQQHQEFRLRNLEILKGRPVVQLPQSIHFNSEERLEDTKRAIGTHGQFTLMVRDQPSKDLADTHFDCETVMVPDAAVNLLKAEKPAATQTFLTILRDDLETSWSKVRPRLEEIGVVTDWEDTFADLMMLKIRRRMLRLLPIGQGAYYREKERQYRYQAGLRVDNGLDVMSRGKVIVSDRLHAHLLASLLRRPNIIMDNYYGKIARHIEAWGDFGLTTRVTDETELEHAIAAASV